MRRLNETIATWLSAKFSTMACFWAFNALALLPVAWPASLQTAQFISSGWLQLISLPLLAVGQEISGRRAETRAQQDHVAIMSDVAMLKAIQAEQHQILTMLKEQASPLPLQET
jgi:hypothetical protein